jgi:hypothetical protein
LRFPVGQNHGARSKKTAIASYFRFFFAWRSSMTACAAANLAIGTMKGDALT